MSRLLSSFHGHEPFAFQLSWPRPFSFQQHDSFRVAALSIHQSSSHDYTNLAFM